MSPSETEQETKDRERYTDLAERLAAAWTSYRMGLSGVDSTLKQNRRPGAEPISQGWIQIAKQVNKVMGEAVMQVLGGSSLVPSRDT